MANNSRCAILATTLLNTLLSISLFILVQAIVRIIFIAKYVSSDIFVQVFNHIPLALFNAFRFDAQTSAYATLPLVLIAIIATIIGKSDWVNKIFKWFTAIVSALLLSIGLADIVFYGNFNSHFNLVTFDLLDEEPILILKGVWNDTPIITLLLVAIIVGIIFFYIYKGIYQQKINNYLNQKILIAISLIIIPIAIRGSLGTFTLRAEDIYVSPSTSLNACVPNASFMLKKAWSEKKKQFKLEPAENILAQYGFSNIDEAKSAWLDISVDSAKMLTLDQTLYGTTPESPKAPKMNVVVFLTESWSNQLIDYEAKYDMDLLGEMRKHINEDICFRHFLSATNGTIDAVEHLTISAAYPHIFTSSYRNIEYPTASAKLFRDNGYKTSFVSGIEISWRNLIDVLPLQGFDHVIGKYEILDTHPNAECNTTWGVYDHEMLSFVNEKLSQNTEKPQFMLCLTSTSHTPFEFPDNYQFGKFILNEKTKNAFVTDDATTTDYLHGYQYESNELGRFMTQLKKSPIAQNTIVAITGDHNIRLILPTDEEKTWLRYSVPLYIYVPNNLVQNADTTRCGSHADIIPTLANLTLSNATYFKAGQDLFADTLTTTIGINTDCVISSQPDSVAQRKANALNALKKIYFSEIFRNRE